MKWLKRLFYLVLFLYVLGCGAVYLQQEKMIFQPSSLPKSFEFWAGEEVYIPVADGIDLHALWLRSRRSQGVVLYWHGNRGSNRRCLRQAENLAGLGYDILMPDYRGYGKSDGQIYSEQQLFSDAQEVYDWLRQHYREDQIVILGYSLGSSAAAYLASENQPRHLCLVAPFQSMLAMKEMFAPFIPSFLLKYPLRNDLRLSEVEAPVTLFHGSRDELIPYDHSVYLQSLRPQASRLVRLNGSGHRGAIFSDLLRRELAVILQ
ncbi:MAG: alpha/beta fold hydrolase [Bacteroidota bacterium]